MVIWSSSEKCIFCTSQLESCTRRQWNLLEKWQLPTKFWPNSRSNKWYKGNCKQRSTVCVLLFFKISHFTLSLVLFITSIVLCYSSSGHEVLINLWERNKRKGVCLLLQECRAPESSREVTLCTQLKHTCSMCTFTETVSLRVCCEGCSLNHREMH